MNKQLEDLLSKFPQGKASNSDLLEFAKQAGLEDADLNDLQQGFSIIEKTTERMKRLDDYRKEGGTLESFVEAELDDITKNLKEEEKSTVVEAFKKATEDAQSNALKEDSHGDI